MHWTTSDSLFKPILNLKRCGRLKKTPFQEMGIIYHRNTGFWGVNYKVTRRMAEMSIAETKFFSSKEEAKRQFEEWLGD